MRTYDTTRSRHHGRRTGTPPPPEDDRRRLRRPRPPLRNDPDHDAGDLPGLLPAAGPAGPALHRAVVPAPGGGQPPARLVTTWPGRTPPPGGGPRPGGGTAPQPGG